MLLKLFVLSIAFSQVVSVEIRQSLPVEVQPFNVNRASPCNENSLQFEQNPRGCSWFWQCKDEDGNLLGIPGEGICPYDLHFDVVNQICTYPGEVYPSCSFDDNNAALIPAVCEPWSLMKLIPHTYSCDKYFVCWQDRKLERDCPPGEHFSFFDNGCMPEFLADCHVDHNYCNTFGQELVKRVPTSCTKYHICNQCNGRNRLMELHCNEGTHKFSEIYHHCDVSSAVNCEV